MDTKQKNLLLIVLTALVLFGFSLLLFFGPKSDYSLAERRTMAKMPAVTEKSLTSGSFMADFETYTQDQFPLRDSFRSLKAMTAQWVLWQKDNNGLYLQDGYLSKLEYPLNEARVERSAKKLADVYDLYLRDSGSTVYYAIIPDKNYFLAPLGGYPAMDYDALVQRLQERLSFAEYIDLFPHLSLEDFYRTDQHWRQERLVPIARTLSDAMGVPFTDDFTEVALEAPFYGAYVGQAALPIQADRMVLLTDEALEHSTLTSYNTGKPVEKPVYDLAKAEGRDPYELFLGGSDALVVLENPHAATDGELIVFRDSFGSTLLPLLAQSYGKITVIDLRYLRSDLLPQLVEFHGQDVLFLYSTLVINNTLSQ